MSRSRSLLRTRQTEVKCSWRSSFFMRDASWPSSILPTSDLLALDNPISRSTARGGAVHMRSVGECPIFDGGLPVPTPRRRRRPRKISNVYFAYVPKNSGFRASYRDLRVQLSPSFLSQPQPARPGAGDEELARGGGGRESATVVLFPRHAEAGRLTGWDERPDAAAKARSEGGRRDRAERAGRGDEADRLRDLVSQMTLGAGLRAPDGVAERGGVPRLEGIGGRRHEDLALLEKLLESVQQLPGGERRTGGDGQEPSNPLRSAGRANRLTERLSGSAGAAPELEDRGRGERQAVVGLARASRLLRRHAARADDERPLGRQGNLPLEPNRAERVLRELTGAAAEDRRVVFAPAEGAHPPIAGQAAEGEAILDRAEIAGEILGASDIRPVGGMSFELIDVGERREDRDDERAAAREAGRARQGGSDGNIGAVQRAREVARDTADHRRRIRPPASVLRALLLIGERRTRFEPENRIGDSNDAVRARLRDHADSPLDGAEKTAPARVVGVLAEHLDASRNKPPRRAFGSAPGEQREALLCRTEESRLTIRFSSAPPRRREPFGDLFHGSAVIPRSRSATAATSEGRERSRTPSRLRTTLA